MIPPEVTPRITIIPTSVHLFTDPEAGLVGREEKRREGGIFALDALHSHKSPSFPGSIIPSLSSNGAGYRLQADVHASV